VTVHQRCAAATASIDMLTFDRRQVMDQIDPLPKRLRVAFAAACAERQLPNYVRTRGFNATGTPAAVTSMLRELWDSAERNSFERSVARKGTRPHSSRNLSSALRRCDSEHRHADIRKKAGDGAERAAAEAAARCVRRRSEAHLPG